MLLILLAYLGGVLTILSPCILPVLPFVFARADQPFLKNGLPLLVGMALTFAGVATLAAVGGGAALAANQAGRTIALVLLAGFALLLIFPALSTRAMAPLVGWGERLSNRTGPGASGVGTSLLLGVATGLLWAPCAGPILGLILTGAAIGGASASTVLLLTAYALGAATSLGLALLVGGKVFAAMKRSIGAGERVRQALGVLILAGVAVIALGLDTRLLTRLSANSTFSLEQGLASRLGVKDSMPQTSGPELLDEGPLPAFSGATGWLNSKPLTAADLKGKVVLVDFWTYSCINCIRSVPHIEALYKRYGPAGLVVIGVHSPEFAFERDPANVAAALKQFGLTYPIALDSDLNIWRAFNNRYWPATYLADAKGRIRYHHFGEGGEATTEAAIRQLLTENGARLGGMAAEGADQGAALAASRAIASPETYLGTSRAQNFAGNPIPPTLALNQWALGGSWTRSPQSARLNTSGGKIAFRFKARDLHLVLGSAGNRPVHFTVTLDDQAPGADHGVDTDANGRGVVTDHRLYQLVRQQDPKRQRTFTITFDDPGVEAYAFTFG
ncbi:cytochrome c biogenesis protein DipZ [Sphingomonas sp. ASV193]|uniref:cytochrome c biogenesis protein DipZ n=1 Tax=Sphingomonas sp. ASV193 TaxID=3144405 RepID=UPI0032E8FDD9